MEGRSCSCFKRVWIVCYKIETATLTTEEKQVNMKVLFQGLCREGQLGWRLGRRSFGEVENVHQWPKCSEEHPSSPMLCQLFTDAVSRLLISDPWIFRCVGESLCSSCVPENRIQQWWNPSQHHDIEDESSPEKTSVNSQIGTAGSCIASPTSSFNAASVTIRSSNWRNVSVDWFTHHAVLDQKCWSMETLRTTPGEQDTRTN